MNVYVASSWRNKHQPEAIKKLTLAGIECYDFRNPSHGRGGFNFRSVDPNWEKWNVEQYRKAMNHKAAIEGFTMDLRGMVRADACLLVLPCGASAHTEAGWLAGRDRPVCVWATEFKEAELMYKLFSEDVEPPVFGEINECVVWLKNHTGFGSHRRKKGVAP